MIPVFPEFAPIALAHKPELDAVLARTPPLASEYTFTNLFAWGAVTEYALARFGEGLLIRKGAGHYASFLQPLVPGDGAAAVRACLDYATGGGPVHLERVGEDFVARTHWDGLDVALQEDRDHFDYLYRVPELIELRGPRYHDKKNLLNQFTGRYAHRYLPMTPEIVARCLAFQHTWCEERACEENDGLAREHCAIHRMLTHFTALELHGGVIEVDGAVVALTLGEPLNPETYVIHIEKALSGMSGLYQVINQAFLADAAAGVPYVNREQDLGLPGLRRAKQSYNPVRLIKKFTVTRRR